MIKPYNFQEDIILQIRTAMLEGHKHILVQSPTGSGKTVIFSNIVFNADKKNKRCLILTDRIELLTGTEGTVEHFGIYTSKILSGQKTPKQEDYTKHCIAMSQTLRRRIGKPSWEKFFNSFDLVIIDEAHIQEFNIYFEKMVFENKPFILGFTATPKRSRKQRQLKEDYTILIPGPQIPELISKGFLVKDKYFASRYFDTNGIKINSFGDFQESSMFEKFENNISYESIVENYIRHANNTVTIVFCVNIEHTIKTCAAFNKAGIKSKFIVSSLSKPIYKDEMSDEQFVRYQIKDALYKLYVDHMAKYSGNRNDIITAWENNEFPVLVNTGIYTKGYDHKPTETIMVLRATTSETLWLQMIGRGSRTYTNKTHFNILDFGSNAERLGLYNQERVWDLNGTFSNSEGVAPVKECGMISGKQKTDKNGKPGCNCLILASRKVCNYCGYIFEKEKLEIDMRLVEITYDEKSIHKYEDIDFAKLERTAEDRGYKFGWVINQIIALGGYDAIVAFQEYKQYRRDWLWRIQKQYDKAIKTYDRKMQDEVLLEKSEDERVLF